MSPLDVRVQLPTGINLHSPHLKFIKRRKEDDFTIYLINSVSEE
jgi:hypothetical protein